MSHHHDDEDIEIEEVPSAGPSVLFTKVHIERETEKAFLVEMQKTDKKLSKVRGWIPKSAMKNTKLVEGGVLFLKGFIVDAKGWR
jgi:hypothetical protein